MLLVSGKSKFFYDYVPLSLAGRQGYYSSEFKQNIEFTTRDLGIPDGTVIEFIPGQYGNPSSYDETEKFTLTSPLAFYSWGEDWPDSSYPREDGVSVVDTKGFDDWVWYKESKGSLVNPDTELHCKMRYSY